MRKTLRFPNHWEAYAILLLAILLVALYVQTKNRYMTFEELGVNEPLRRAIEELGFEAPMPVQEKVIPHLLGQEGDVVALAQTGTGKTAAFGLPVLQRIDVDRHVPQALVLSPTRELCLQIWRTSPNICLV